MPRDLIFIHELRVDCIVGICDHERERIQPLFLDVELGLDMSAAAFGGHIDATCDYARVASELVAMLEFRRYYLLEMAAEELCAMLLGVHPMLDDVRLRIRKPHALAGRAREPGVEMFRTARERAHTREPSEFGEIETLLETSDARLYLLHVEPGREIPADHQRSMRELEWLVDGELEGLQGFAPVTWQKPRTHRHVNTGSKRATLFCCDSEKAPR
jgi:FolB domain-containing protein